MGAGRDAGSEAKGLEKALAIRVTFNPTLGQPLTSQFWPLLPEIVMLRLFSNG